MIEVREVMGVVECSRQDLMEIEVHRPYIVTDKWRGIQHGRLVDFVSKDLKRRGIRILNEHWWVSGNHRSHLQGFMILKIPTIECPDGIQHCLGLQHANSGQMCLRIVCGGRVMICSNGLIIGTVALKRKHTCRMDLQKEIERGLDRYLQEIGAMGAFIGKLKGTEMDDLTADFLLMEAGRKRLLPWSRIGLIDREWRKPTWDEFADRTCWSLFNAFTYVVQKNPPHRQMPVINKFRGMLLEAIE